MTKEKNKPTDDAVEILYHRYVKDDPETLAELEKIQADNDVARKIYDLRTKAGLSQRALAKLVGTTASVICRLEDADYEGHSLAMLNRIAAALNKRVEIRFFPIKEKLAFKTCLCLLKRTSTICFSLVIGVIIMRSTYSAPDHVSRLKLFDFNRPIAAKAFG